MNLREYRRIHQLTQTELAEKLGLHRSALAHYERGARVPRSSTLERFQEKLGLGLDEPDRSLLSPKQVQSAFPDVRSRVGKPIRSPAWRRLVESHPDLMGYLGPVPPMLEAWIHADSTFECLAWLQLYRAGAKLYFESPVLKGCPGAPLCYEGQTLGLRLLPCFFQPGPPIPYLCWPQVEMRTSWKTYRVDALVAAQIRGSVVWMIVELDGPGHRSDLDERRTEALRKKVLRFDASHVYGLEFSERLLKRISREFMVELGSPDVT